MYLCHKRNKIGHERRVNDMNELSAEKYFGKGKSPVS